MTETTDNAAPAGQADAGQVLNSNTTPDATPTPTTAPAEQPNNTPPAWFDSFNDDDKGYILNKGWDKEDGTSKLLDSYKNLEKMRGVPADRLLTLPDKADDLESWAKVYDRLGRPETVEGYEYKAPEGVQTDPERMKWAGELSHKLGLNKNQYKALVDNTIDYETKLQTQFNEQKDAKRVESLKKLKDEWGSAYDERQTLAERGLMHFMDDKTPETIAKLQESLGHADVLKMFSNIGMQIGEDKIPSADGERPFGYTPEQAKQDMKKLMQEMAADRARLDAHNRGKGSDFEEMTRLRNIAYGGGK